MRVPTLAASLVLLLAIGCGDDGGGGGDSDASSDDDDDDDDDDDGDASIGGLDVSGWYSLTSYRSGDCADLLEGKLPAEYIWIEALDTAYILHNCSDQTEASCTATPFYDFTTPIGYGWSAEGGSAFFDGDCTLAWERTELTLADGQLLVRSWMYDATVLVIEDECTLEAAAGLDDCTYEIEVTATPLAP